MASHNEIEDDRNEIEEPKQTKAGIINIVAIGGLCLLGMVLIYFVIALSNKTEEVKEEKRLLVESVPEYTIPVQKKPKPIKKEIAAIPKPEPRPIVVPPARKEEPKKDEGLTLQQRRMLPELGSDGKQSAAPTAGNNIGEGNIGFGSQNLNLDTTATAQVVATRLKDQGRVVPKGVPIPCGMSTAIQSDQSGIIICTTTEDIYSADGTTILIDRGSNVTGEYRTASITLGKRRVFAIWDRIRTPDGVLIQVDSPATDGLGRAGIGGYINNHYLERFGSAVLVSLIDDTVNGRGNNSTLNSTRQEAGEISSEFLSQFQRIQPTLQKPQGGEVTILVARDLNLSSVYGLKYVK